MTINDLFNLVKGGATPVIKFGKDFETYQEDSAENGMMGKIIKATDKYVDENCATFNVSLEPFQKLNESVASTDWYDKEQRPVLTWFETNFYPKDGIVEVVIPLDVDCLNVLEIQEENSLTSEYLSARQTNDISYTNWLEQQLISLRKSINP